MPPPAPCQSEACAIQDCLSANNFQETKCLTVIDKLYNCCSRMYEMNSNSKSTACPKPEVVRRKLEEQKKRFGK